MDDLPETLVQFLFLESIKAVNLLELENKQLNINLRKSQQNLLNLSANIELQNRLLETKNTEIALLKREVRLLKESANNNSE